MEATQAFRALWRLGAANQLLKPHSIVGAESVQAFNRRPRRQGAGPDDELVVVDQRLAAVLFPHSEAPAPDVDAGGEGVEAQFHAGGFEVGTTPWPTSPQSCSTACTMPTGSQMAAAFLTHLSQGAVDVRSAGSEPADRVNPAAVAAMAEVGNPHLNLHTSVEGGG